MKTIKSILNAIKLCLVIPLQLIAGIIMLGAILIFALATLINSPKEFVIKWQIVYATIKKIWTDLVEKIKQDRINKKYNGEL